MEMSEYTIQLIQGKVKEEHRSFHEALIELKGSALPTDLCIARTLSLVTMREVILQVMNFSPTPITIYMYKGIRLGEATCRHNLMPLGSTNNVAATQTGQPQTLDFTFDSPDLTASEKTWHQDLLTQFANLFAPEKGPVGWTWAIKHSIPTEGPPVCNHYEGLLRHSRLWSMQKSQRCWGKECWNPVVASGHHPLWWWRKRMALDNSAWTTGTYLHDLSECLPSPNDRCHSWASCWCYLLHHTGLCLQLLAGGGWRVIQCNHNYPN